MFWSDDEDIPCSFTQHRRVEPDYDSDLSERDADDFSHNSFRAGGDSFDESSKNGSSNADVLSLSSDGDTNDSDDEEDDGSDDEGSHHKSNESNPDDSGVQVTTKAAWAKRRNQIIHMLLDNSHDIHLLMGKTKKEKCEKIWKKYAPEFDKSLVTTSISRCLLQLKNG